MGVGEEEVGVGEVGVGWEGLPQGGALVSLPMSLPPEDKG